MVCSNCGSTTFNEEGRCFMCARPIEDTKVCGKTREEIERYLDSFMDEEVKRHKAEWKEQATSRRKSLQERLATPIACRKCGNFFLRAHITQRVCEKCYIPVNRGLHVDSEKLGELIKKSGFRKYTIEQKLGLPSGILSRYTLGQNAPTFEKAHKLANFLGVDVQEFWHHDI